MGNYDYYELPFDGESVKYRSEDVDWLDDNNDIFEVCVDGEVSFTVAEQADELRSLLEAHGFDYWSDGRIVDSETRYDYVEHYYETSPWEEAEQDYLRAVTASIR